MINWVFGWISIDYLLEKGVINDKQAEKNKSVILYNLH